MAKAFTVNSKLRKYESKIGRQVIIRVRTKTGFETEIPVYDYINGSRIPISVHRSNWNKGFVTGGTYHISNREINFLLQKVERNVKDAVEELISKGIKLSREIILHLTYINEENHLENERKINSGEILVDEDGGAFASKEEFVELVKESDDPKFDELKKKIGVYHKKYILDYWDGFIKDSAPNSYNSVKNSIKFYIQRTEDNCKAASYSSEWLYRFFRNIIDYGYSFKKDGSDPKDFSIDTIKKYKKIMISFGKYLFEEEKVLDNQDYVRFKLRKSSKKQSLIKYDPPPYRNTQALFKSEFDQFYNYEFEDKNFEIARDMFVFQTWLGGIRVQDFLKIKRNEIQKDAKGNYRVSFLQNKTTGKVDNVVGGKYLESLLHKYQSFDVFFKAGKYNEFLKQAAKLAGLNRELDFEIALAKADKPEIVRRPIYEMIVNAWTRNCATSILVELGNQDDLISKFIGHKGTDMINHYKSIHQKDVDRMMNEVAPEKPTLDD